MGKHHGVERSRLLSAAPEDVYPLIADLRSWIVWSPWEQLDPTMTRTYAGPDEGAGACYLWIGNRQVGQGAMEVLEAEAPTRVVVRLTFLAPSRSEVEAVFELRPEAGGTRVTWRMSGPDAGVVRLLGRLFALDRLVGRDVERGLDRLAAQVA